MSMSISTAEAGLIAAPWDAARQNDPGLAAAAQSFYEQSKDLTQHGKKDHPTDRIVLGDVAATLALELGAQDPAHRAASLSEYVKLPGSGDGFEITVHADGHETLDRTAHGPDGATSQPGAAAVIARYAAVIGHTPSQDELAGFLAGVVAGGSLPGGASSSGSVMLTVTGTAGQVLAMGTASMLLAEWQDLVVANGMVTPNVDVPGQPVLQNATEGAACLLQMALAGGTASGALVGAYDGQVSWFAQVDQPMLAVAAHYEALAHGPDAGNADRVELDETAAHLALAIAAEPEAARGALSQTLHIGGKQTEVTVSQTSTDITGGAQFHDIDQGLGGILEQVVGIVADVLSFVPVVDAVAIPVAIAVGAAEGAQELSDGDILGGVLALAGAAAGGVGQYADVVGEAVGSTTAEVTSVARDVSMGVAAAQGVDGAVTAAEDGDPLAVLTSLAGGVAGSVGAGTAWGRDLAVGSALTGAGVAAAGGNWTSALAATETAAAGAGLFGDRNPDASGPASAGADGSDPPPGWQSAATVPVQQQDLPAVASAVADIAASTAPAAQASAASVMTQATSSDTGTAGANAPDGSSQQQADAQQAAQVQAAQRAGALTAQLAQNASPGVATDAPQPLLTSADPSLTVTASGPAASDPLSGGTVQFTPPDGSGPQTAVIAGKSSDGGYWLQGGGFVGSAYVTGVTPPAGGGTSPSSTTGGTPSLAPASPAAPLLMTGTVAATVGGSTGSTAGTLATAGGLAEDAVGLAARGAAALGEGLLGTVALPAAVLAGIFWPTSTASDDTLTSHAAPGGTTATQNSPPDSNAPAPPPPAVSPSGQTGSPTGPEDPDGNSTVQDSQQTTQQTNNRVTLPASSASANNGGSINVEAGTYSESEVRAAQQVADEGNAVVLRQPSGQRSPTGNTSDLLVNGENYDIYTPETSNPTRVIDGIAKKADQAKGVILDLSQTGVKSSDLGDIQARLAGKGIKNLDVKVVGE